MDHGSPVSLNLGAPVAVQHGSPVDHVAPVVTADVVLNDSPSPVTLHPTPFTLHLTPYTLRPTPCTLHLTPYPLPPTPWPLAPIPYSLHPSLPSSLKSAPAAALGGDNLVWREQLSLEGTTKRGGNNLSARPRDSDRQVSTPYPRFDAEPLQKSISQILEIDAISGSMLPDG